MADCRVPFPRRHLGRLVGRNTHDDEASGAFGRLAAPQSILVDRAGNDSPRHALPGARSDRSALFLAHSRLLQPDERHERGRDDAAFLHPAYCGAHGDCASAQSEVAAVWSGRFGGKIGDIFNKARGPITWIVLFLAFGICAYTGFLISALIRYPLINTAVLPALFVASGVSAGTAAAKLLATAVFGEKRDSHAMHILHLAEWPMMAAEISCIFMIAMAMIFGMAGAQAAVTAFTTGVWAAVFWVGAVGVGFGVPFALGMTGCTRSAAGFWTAGFAAVAGMMCLRLFILYAGQLNSLMLTPV